MARSLPEALDRLLPDGWTHDAARYGLSFSLTCPHGHQVEQDGTCPEGCTSPLRQAGLI